MQRNECYKPWRGLRTYDDCFYYRTWSLWLFCSFSFFCFVWLVFTMALSEHYYIPRDIFVFNHHLRSIATVLWMFRNTSIDDEFKFVTKLWIGIISNPRSKTKRHPTWLPCRVHITVSENYNKLWRIFESVVILKTTNNTRTQGPNIRRKMERWIDKVLSGYGKKIIT